MAAKRGKSQARRSGGNEGMPGWAWLVLGVALTVAVFFFAPKYLGKGGADGFFRPTPNPDARPPAVDAQSEDEAPIVEDGARPEEPPASDDAATPKEQDYDFYSVLSGEETPLTDAELDRRARAEAEAERSERERQEREQQALAERARREREARETPPPAIDGDAADARTTDAGTTGSRSARSRDSDAADLAPAARPTPTPERTAATSETLDARYLLQAGAFAASGDAEALKAKIAFLGLSARVESAQIQGKTVYRVRMGPYGTATELADARKTLSANGLQAMAIKVK